MLSETGIIDWQIKINGCISNFRYLRGLKIKCHDRRIIPQSLQIPLGLLPKVKRKPEPVRTRKGLGPHAGVLGSGYFGAERGGSTGGSSQKKKVQTRFGRIEIGHSSRHSQQGSLFHISPFMQEQMTFCGQSLVYAAASEMLFQTLRVKVVPSQIYRVCDTYGLLVGEDLLVEAPVAAVAQDDVLYAEADGSMVLTHEGYKEAKVGRTFLASDCRQKQDKEDRGAISSSDYVAQITDCKDFIKRFELRLEPYRGLGKRLVFISDGAVWIDNWIREQFPDATQILDFFHVMEWLGKCAEAVFPDLSKRAEWLEKQRKTLREEPADKVVAEVKKLVATTPAASEKLASTLNYLGNNLHRMNYREYREQGLIIGSGAIESAHRTLIQTRMKKSGQRWTNEGANRMINLRVCYLSQRWHLVKNNILMMTNSYAIAA